MLQKSFVVLISILVMSILVACTSVAPEENQDTAASQPAAEEATEVEAAPEQEASEATASESGEEATEVEAASDQEASESTEAAASESGEEMMYTIDTAASTLIWTGSKPIGSSEAGTIDISEGQMTVMDNQLVSGSFVIDMTTITPTDLSGDMANRLAGHLNSDDFFGVETYPTSSLTLKSAEPTDVDNQYLVTADLTVKEITEEITFITDVTVEEGTLTATADIVFDRANFDVRFGSGSFFENLGDDLINDDIEMAVTLVAMS